MFAATAALLLGAASLSTVSAQAGVWATGPMGVTNPPKPIMGTPINQTSDARLISLNAIDDFCLWAPPNPEVIGNSEAYEVAWCTKARNNARVIPDGTFTGLSMVKTDFYIQIMGYGDFTKINLMPGDFGGELDPHGAEGLGNPVGGNITVNINGEDKNVEEWMSYISYSQFCFRACINSNSTYSAAAMCEHKLDVMGCNFVMPGNYGFNGTFETCDADVAYPPGWYPSVVGGQTTYSQFQQYWTGVVGAQTFTVGDTVTPQSVAFTPSSSNCKTTSTIGNGIPLSLLTAGATGPVPTNPAATQPGATVQGTVGASGAGGASGTGTNKPPGSTGTSGSSGSSGSKGNGAISLAAQGMTLMTLVAAIAGVALIH
ncbi:hypothetical protein E1B28_003025 [Marasmius oreades]|uniref:Uncharacterized protein n=1 Tax=Marasmius oreades TaxID=181124 RepID=A0A9P7RKK4_9AGAR|nr:uncharacterized protein E1B28_003025 [Marasmius oreades]KAG7085464.1 hypothetical protein E1B28_003025 [Marasmius oreades]